MPGDPAYQIKDRTQAHKDFCQQNSFAERLERTQVVGYNRSVSSKETEAAKNTIFLLSEVSGLNQKTMIF